MCQYVTSWESEYVMLLENLAPPKPVFWLDHVHLKLTQQGPYQAPLKKINEL